MAVIRLDSDERRKAIVRAAVPLFARKGFAGTTTRELAEAAGISEALLFKHFPSKQSLYREIRQLGCEGDPALETLASLPPSTATLVWMMRFMVRHFLGADGERARRARFAAAAGRAQFSRRRRICARAVRGGVRARPAAVRGLLRGGGRGRRYRRAIRGRATGRPRNLFWFAQHVPAMLALAGLPGRNCVPYEGTLDELVDEATAFILRGIGMRDDAIAAGAGAGARDRRGGLNGGKSVMDGDLKTFVRLDEDGSDAVARAPARRGRRRAAEAEDWCAGSSSSGCCSRWCSAGCTASTGSATRRSRISSPATSRRRRRSRRSRRPPQTVPRSATGIGSLAAVQQVTVTPEVGGRVTEILFKPGDAVKAGDPLVQLNDAPDRADLANYEAQARWAAASLERARAVGARGRSARSRMSIEWQSQLDQARASILKTQAIIDQKQVKAPFAGRLGMRQVNLGEIVTPGSKLVTLTDLHQLYANFTLPSTMREQVKLGQEVEVTVDAFPGRIFKAKITTIEPQIRTDTRMMSVQATLPNPDEALLPGMFVNAAVVLPPEPDRVVLPETAVDYTLYGDSVYLVREDGDRRRRQAGAEGVPHAGQDRQALGAARSRCCPASSRATRSSRPGRSNCRTAGPSSSPASRRPPPAKPTPQ